MSDHTQCQWHSAIVNAVEEAVAEELLPYKELFTTVVLQQDYEQLLYFVFVSLQLPNLVMDGFLCKRDEF